MASKTWPEHDREALRIMDIEANYFALHLLVPEEWLLADLAKMGGIDIEDERKMEALAKRYRVSLPVMIFRIAILKGGRVLA